MNVMIPDLLKQTCIWTSVKCCVLLAVMCSLTQHIVLMLQFIVFLNVVMLIWVYHYYAHCKANPFKESSTTFA